MSGNPFQLQGRVATVTGGGRGIGRGIVLALAQAGADIAIADIDLDSARKTAGEVEALGQRVCVVSVDVTDAISCRAGAETILEDLVGSMSWSTTREACRPAVTRRSTRKTSSAATGSTWWGSGT